MDWKQTTTYIFGFKLHLVIHKKCIISGFIYDKNEYFIFGIKYKTITKPQ